MSHLRVDLSMLKSQLYSWLFVSNTVKLNGSLCAALCAQPGPGRLIIQDGAKIAVGAEWMFHLRVDLSNGHRFRDDLSATQSGSIEHYVQHYVPNLALEVTQHNEDSANAERSINLQGFLVGEHKLASNF